MHTHVYFTRHMRDKQFFAPEASLQRFRSASHSGYNSQSYELTLDVLWKANDVWLDRYTADDPYSHCQPCNPDLTSKVYTHL